ncbi:uncharacterized protein [Asterias amurensis]|uniref:uncharacterized protein n=1 Tax=Asterias amurensis TaxID=7602 RepID=UPI003AB8484F
MSIPKPKSGSSLGLRAWLREYLQPTADGVSHTKVQVLSKTKGDPWSNPSSHENIQSPWKRISDIRGEKRSNATKLRSAELSQQNGAKNTSDDNPDRSGKSSRNSRSFRQALRGSNGNRRTAKVAPLPAKNSEQKGALKTSNAPTSSRKLPKEFGSLLQEFPNCRGNQSTGKSTPTPVGASKSCMSNDSFAHERTTQDLILSNLDDRTTLKKPPNLHSVGKQLEQRNPRSKILGNGLLQRKNEAGKCEEKKLLSKKREPVKHSRGQESLINIRGGRGVAVQKEKRRISLDHGDNKLFTSPGFLLHSKPTRGGATSPSRRGRRVHDLDSIQREPKPYSWTSQSSMYDIWKKTEESEDGTKLADGDSEDSLTPSGYIEQKVDSVKPPGFVGRSHTMKPQWFTDFNTTNDASKMPKPKTHRGLVTNKASGKEDFDFLSHDHCNDKRDTAHGAQAIGQNHPMGDLGVSSKTEKKDVNIWRNDFEENGTLENIIEEDEEEEEDSIHSSVDSSCLSLVKNTWYGGDRCEENTLSETVDREDSLKEDIRFDDCQKENGEDSGDDNEEKELTIKELEKLNEIQKEQWELAALGEWSLICNDNEDYEEYTNIYLMMNEFEKEQEVMEHLKSIICEFQHLQVIKDFQKMLTVPGCPKEQVRRALRQFARICHGPVPLTVSGQSKAEAVASLSVNLRHRTKRFPRDQLFSFKEFASVLEELDTLRDRQDSVEVSLKINLRKEEARRREAQPPKRIRRKIPRWAPSGDLSNWEVDTILMNMYSLDDGKIKSSSRIDVMQVILE